MPDAKHIADEPLAGAPSLPTGNSLFARLQRWFGVTDQASLPPDVREAIARNQDAGEVLIGWSQLAVVVIFLLLYAASPQMATDRSAIAPVVLGAYLVATLTRLFFARAGRLPSWALYLSIMLDFALLYALIWSFHLQYEQPPAFYLKAPTLLYVFIFIALRALRFQVRYVAVAGAVAAIGWLALAWYALNIRTIDSPVTTDYVVYMTSSRVLLGAEIDKIVSIILVTLTLMLAINRARNLMIRSILERTAARDLSRFVPATVAAQVSDSHARVEAGDRERREASVLFVDIEAFTSMVETLEPEDVIEVLNEYFAEVGAIIEAQGGVINQFQGDAILASFNVPDPNPEHATAAVRAGLKILDACAGRTFGDNRLNVRVGICTGTLVGGIVGTGSRLSYTVHGDVVNTASRLEQLNKRFGTRLLVAGTTAEQLATDAFALTEVGEVSLAGKQEPTRIYAIAPTPSNEDATL
ncbi:MAG: adenylate/guanylate cyclase domain-containing protein [Pseudomonadota bacterium]